MKTKFFKHPQALVNPKAKIGQGTRVWAFANILAGASVGNNCNICDGCYIESKARIGNHVTLKNGVCVFDGITLGDDVFIGAHTCFINDRYPRSNRKDAWTLEPTLIKKGATIGANATILCGVTIGEYAVVGAGAVVTRDVTSLTIVTGNPAKVHGFVCCCGRPLGKTLRCSCGLKYKLDKSNKLKVGSKQ